VISHQSDELISIAHINPMILKLCNKLNKRKECYLRLTRDFCSYNIVQYIIKIYKKSKEVGKGRLLISRIVEMAPFLIIPTRIREMKPRDSLDSIVHSIVGRENLNVLRLL